MSYKIQNTEMLNAMKTEHRPRVTILKRNGNYTNLGTIFRNAVREDIDSVFRKIEPREIRRIF